MMPLDILNEFDKFLANRSLRLDAVIVGGTALNLLGYITRQTRDVDVIVPELSSEIVKASMDFAKNINSYRTH